MSRQCLSGKPCGSSCIHKSRKCRKNLTESAQTSLSRARSFLSNLPELLEHAGSTVAAWKTGKVIAPVVSKYLESAYNIPSEASLMLAETVIQGVTATALSARHLKNREDFVEKLLVETSAAFIGKTAHKGTENAIETAEIRDYLKVAVPLIAGKLSGIGVTLAGSRLSQAREIAKGLVSRSKEDTQKLLTSAQSLTRNFAEPPTIEPGMIRLLGDIAAASLYLTKVG